MAACRIWASIRLALLAIGLTRVYDDMAGLCFGAIHNAGWDAKISDQTASKPMNQHITASKTLGGPMPERIPPAL